MSVYHWLLLLLLMLSMLWLLLLLLLSMHMLYPSTKQVVKNDR